jgi:hypothetical protein
MISISSISINDHHDGSFVPVEVFTVNFLAACCDAFSIPVRELAALGRGAKVDSCCETERYLPNEFWGFFRNQHWNFNAKIS